METKEGQLQLQGPGTTQLQLQDHHPPTDVNEVDLNGQGVIHIFRTRLGMMFSMSEIAVEIFKENPGSFQKEIRAGRYQRFHMTDQDVLLRLAQVNIPPESITVVGATLLPPDSVEAILQHRRKTNLVTIIRIALLKMVTAEAAKLLGEGLFEDALPITIDAIQRSRLLYYPWHKLQLVPAYLLGAQANLGLGRAVPSEDMLGVAAWLLVGDKSQANKNQICAEITRLFGQLYFLEVNDIDHGMRNLLVTVFYFPSNAQKRYDMALKAFGENVFYTSLEYGHMDLRNTLGIYNLSKIFQAQDQIEQSRRCSDVVVGMWLLGLKEVVLNVTYVRMTPWGKAQFPGMDQSSNRDFKSQIATMYFKEVTDMLQDISSYRAATSGERDVSVAEACLVLGLAFTYTELFALARQHLENAADIYLQQATKQDLLETIRDTLKLISGFR